MIEYDSTLDIARMLGVTQPAVSNWLMRWTTYSAPDAKIGDLYGWLPEKRDAWRAWRDANRAQRAAGDYEGR
jgi:hypothetical protein